SAFPDTVCVTGCIDYSWSIDSTNAIEFIRFFDGQGNTFNSPGNPINICYPLPGIYTASIVDSNVCGVDIASLPVVVNDTIQENVTADTLEGCTPFTVNFTNNSSAQQDSILNFDWSIFPTNGVSFTSGTNASDRNVSLEFTDIGTFVVTLIMNNQCDTDTLTFEVISRRAPDVALQPVLDTICVTGCVDYIWTLNNTNAVNTTSFFDGVALFPAINPNDSITVCYPIPGTYEIFVANSNVCGVDTARANITVNDTITTDITPTLTVGCVPFDVSFANNSSVLQGQIDSIRWTVDGDPTHFTFSGGSNDTSTSPILNFTFPRNYQVCAVLYNECDIDTVCFEIIRQEAPAISLANSEDTLCVNECIDFSWLVTGINADSTNALDSVVFHDGQGNILINPVDSFQICYPDSGIFFPFIEVYNVCGADTDSVRIQITAPIQPQVSLDTTAGCVPFTVNAFNTSTQPFGNPLTYLWTIDGQVSSSTWTISNVNTAQPSFQFLNPGNYDVCVTLFGDCDTVTLCEIVNASGAPSISLQPSIDTICVTGCVDYVWTLNNTNAGINVAFFDGILLTSNPNDSVT
ncbi:MAG: hypothetical protein AAFV78_10605, partial [Bacteroidota bacterium]